MDRLNIFIILTQVLGFLFAVFAFGITIFYSSVEAPGGSLLGVLTGYPVFRLPLSVIGGLFIVLILATFGLYAKMKKA